MAIKYFFMATQNDYILRSLLVTGEGINFYFWYYDANGTRIDEWSTYFTNILPKKHTIFEFWCPSTGKTFDFEWDIILPEMRQ